MTERETPLSSPQGAEALAVAEGSNAPQAPYRATAWNRAGHYFAKRGWAHLTLLAGVGVFLLPFAWMVGMSVKTDDEANSAKLFPSVPTFRAASPVVRPVEVTDPPTGAADRWATVAPLLRERAVAVVAKRPLPAGGDRDTDALRAAAADALVHAAAEQMRETVWAEPDANVLKAFDAVATPEKADTALADHLGRFEIRGLDVHDLAGDVFPVVPRAASATGFRVVAGDGQLFPLPAGGGAYLRYHFASADAPPVVLEATFDPRVKPADLQSLVFAYRGDDSWHRIDAELTVGDTRWHSAVPTYVAQYRDAAATFQPPSFADQTYQAKTWVDFKPERVTAASGNSATLRLTLHPSSTSGAVWGKVQRNYRRAFRSVPFWTYVGNSLLLVALNVGGAVFSASLVGYAFARLQWPGRSIAFGLLLATMMLPAQVTMIPSFVIWRALGWYNTLNPLWVTAWTGSAFFIFLMVQFMRTIPRELEEAARIDGLNTVQTWWYVIVPLVKPTLAAIAIMVFMASWNDFMGPLVMLRDQSRFPLSLGLFGLNIDQKADWTLIMAGNMLMTLPVIAVFFVFQRYFIEGVTVSGMKG